MSFDPISKQLLFKSSKPNDIRLGELCLGEIPAGTSAYVFGGYPDDEGIGLNSGRQGAKDGPDAIRQCFYKMTPRPDCEVNIFDHGNLDTSLTLSERHEAVRQAALGYYQQGHRWIGLGGGHDYGFPDAAAFLDHFKGQDPLVINFDAHLDVRPTTQGLSSGTPFYRLLEEFEGFGFIEVGIQQQCNTEEHIKWCESKGGEILCFEDLVYSGQTLQDHFEIKFSQHLQKDRPTFLSIDIDGFSSSYAMGCSQAWPLGAEPQQFFPWMKSLKEKLDLRGIGIYEVSPPLDHDSRTAKLAAQIIHHYIFN